MGGRREGSLMREKGQTGRGSRIAVAIVIGVLLGCVFAVFYPHGLFISDPPIRNRRIGHSDLQVPIFYFPSLTLLLSSDFNLKDFDFSFRRLRC